MKRRIALVPSYQPDAQLLYVLQELRAAGFVRIVVDDGSDAAHRSWFDNAPGDTVVLRHALNRGKGAALKTGLGYIREHFSEDAVVVTIDDDGQHSVLDASRCAEVAAANPGSIVLGCRDFSGEQVPVRSKAGNLLMLALFRALAGVRVSDTQTGLRAFTAGLIPFLQNVEGQRYEYETAVLLACIRRGVSLREVRIATIYRDGNSLSRYRTLRDSLRISTDLFKFAGASFAGFLVDYGFFSLLIALTGALGSVAVLVSNVSARMVSATLNYNLNRRTVFHDARAVSRTAPQYFALAACILAGNTGVLWLLAVVIGLNSLVAKLMVELLFFSISWTVQRHLIFRREKDALAAAGQDAGMRTTDMRAPGKAGAIGKVGNAGDSAKVESALAWTRRQGRGGMRRHAAEILAASSAFEEVSAQVCAPCSDAPRVVLAPSRGRTGHEGAWGLRGNSHAE